MELFDEYKNANLLKIIDAINYILHGKNITRQKLVEFMETFSRIQAGNREFELDQEKALIERLFKDGEFKPIENNEVLIIPTNIEINWLQEMLKDPRATSLFTPELLLKLKKTDKANQPLTQDYWLRHYMVKGREELFNDSAYCERLRLIREALRKQVLVYYESYDEFGNQYKGKAAPYKLEYSFLNDSYNLIMWNFEKQFTFKSDVATITKLELLQETIPKDVKALADGYIQELQQTTEPLVLQIIDKSNALNRCFQLFASYDKKVKRLSTNKFELEVKYYSHFDEEEIVMCIKSLGSSVTVIAPDKIRERIISDLQKAWR